MSSSPPHLCLFDIDGTLLLSGGAGQAAMHRTLGDVFDLSDTTGEIAAAGRTDYAITADLFADHGIDHTKESLATFLDSYTGHLADVLPELDGTVLPGVHETLARLQAMPHVTLGLLTGNFFGAAVAKLQHFGLAQPFCERGTLETALGGYGDHDADRDDVARRAWTAAERHPSDFAPERTWVIGDTPSDVQCGRAIGANTVAVATGMFDRDTLAACDPTVLLDTLEDAAWLERIAE